MLNKIAVRIQSHLCCDRGALGHLPTIHENAQGTLLVHHGTWLRHRETRV